MSKIVYHPNLLHIYEINDDDINVELIEETCTSNLYEIIYDNRFNSIIPSDKDILKLWLNLLNGLYALVENCQYHGNITTKNILYKNGNYMLSDPLYYYKKTSNNINNFSDDIYNIAEIIFEYISPCSSINIEDLSIDKNIINLLNDCLDKKITTFQPLFTSSVFVEYQKEECIYIYIY